MLSSKRERSSLFEFPAGGRINKIRESLSAKYISFDAYDLREERERRRTEEKEKTRRMMDV